MNKKTPSSLHDVVAIGSMYAVAGAIPVAFMRIPLGDTSLSMVSLMSIVILTLGIPLFYRNVLFVIQKNPLPMGVVGFFLVTLLLAAIATQTSHAYGIFIEWFLLPISVALVLAHRASHYTEALRGAISLSMVIVITISLTYLANGFLMYDGRLSGPWPSPNHLAMLIAPFVPFLVWRVCVARKSMWRFLHGVILALSTIVLFATQSVFGVMSALAGTIVVGALYYLRNRQIKISRSILGFVIMVSIGIVGLFVVRGSVFVEDVARSSFASRATIWTVTQDLLLQKPLAGYGLGTFQEHYLAQQPYYAPYLEWAVPTPHSLYLTLWFSGGIVALMFFMTLYFSVISRLFALFFHTNTKPPLVVAGGLLIIGLHGFVDTPVFGVDLSYPFWFLCIGGLVMTLAQKK